MPSGGAISSWKNWPRLRCGGIDATQYLALVEPERDRVVRLSRARFPRRRLPRHHRGQAIEVGDGVAIDRLVEREQAGLMRQQLADGDPLLALLRELRPVRGRPARRSRATRASGRAPASSRRGPSSPNRRAPSCRAATASPVAWSGRRPRGRRPARPASRRSTRRRAPAGGRSSPRTRRARLRSPGGYIPRRGSGWLTSLLQTSRRAWVDAVDGVEQQSPYRPSAGMRWRMRCSCQP